MLRSKLNLGIKARVQYPTAKYRVVPLAFSELYT